MPLRDLGRSATGLSLLACLACVSKSSSRRATPGPGRGAPRAAARVGPAVPVGARAGRMARRSARAGAAGPSQARAATSGARVQPRVSAAARRARAELESRALAASRPPSTRPRRGRGGRPRSSTTSTGSRSLGNPSGPEPGRRARPHRAGRQLVRWRSTRRRARCTRPRGCRCAARSPPTRTFAGARRALSRRRRGGGGHRGDAVVRYDQLASAGCSSTRSSTPPYAMCYAVSAAPTRWALLPLRVRAPAVPRLSAPRRLARRLLQPAPAPATMSIARSTPASPIATRC